MQKNWQINVANFIVTPPVERVYDYKNDASLKEQFGIALAQGFKNPFEAACQIFGKETQKSLWASVNWVNDEIVIKARESFTLVTASEENLLDKKSLSLKLLTISEETIIFNGEVRHALEGRDRLKALELYAKIQGFINDKVDINNTINNSNRFMEIKFVEPDKKEETKIIEHQTEIEDILETSPIKLKLVG